MILNRKIKNSLLILAGFLLLILGVVNTPLSTAGNVYYVDADNGSDSNSGSLSDPWKTLSNSIPRLQPGDTLYLRGGTYFESNISVDISGNSSEHISIKNYQGETPVIDGGFPEFRTVPNNDWELYDAVRDIYRSRSTYANADIIHGYLGPGGDNSHFVPYEIYEHLSSDNEDYTETGYVYVGPGVFWNSSDQRVYIRLQPSQQELAMGYNIPSNVDPGQNEIYIVIDGSVVSFINGASYIDVEGIHFKYRSNTLRFETGSHDITVKDSHILGGRSHVFIEPDVHNLTFDNIIIDDGFPVWIAWTDIKRPDQVGNNTVPPAKNLQQNGIKIDTGSNNIEVKNSVIKNTFDGISASENTYAIHIHHNELRGIRDDAINIVTSAYDIEVDHNKMIHVSKGISRVGDGFSPVDPGTKYIHHNIMDLTEKHLHFRFGYPHYAESGDGKIWGRAFGSHSGDESSTDPWKIYNNTILVGDMRNVNYNSNGMGFAYNGMFNSVPQEVYNNIFIQTQDQIIEREINVSDGSNILDGNLYHREVSGSEPIFRSWNDSIASKDFTTLAQFKSDSFFTITQNYYPPGWESSGIEANPMLDSEYRPASGSPATSGAIDLSSKGWPGVNAEEVYRGALPSAGCIYGTDNDNDGYGNPVSPTCAFSGLDCDDSNPDINPGAIEVCDQVDNNCNAIIDEGFDVDGDTYTMCGGDCDDSDPLVHPNQLWYEDIDGDGYSSHNIIIQCQRPTDCKIESELTDSSVDCNDNEPAINPGAAETCDGIDNDCNGTPDEGCECINGTTQGCGTDVGVCQSGTQSCVTGQWGACEGEIGPGAEVCDGSDNDCDGVTDEDCIVINGLVGYWRLDETSGTTAFDSSGLGNHGTLVNGPTWTTGETGGGLSFDGIDNYVTAGSDASVNITGNITVSAWIYMNSLPSAFARDFTIVSKGTALNYYKFRIDSGTDKAEMLLDTGTGVICTDTTTNLEAGQWYHIAGRYNGTTQQLFINGIAGTSCSDTGNIDQNASDILCIGNNECGIKNDKGFDGIIDDVRIYNRALSDSEIQQLYNDTKSSLTCTSFTYSEWSSCQSDGTQTRIVISSSPDGCTGGDPVTTRSCSVPPIDSNLIGYWRLDETGGTTAFDSSGLGNHGTLVNGPTWTTGETGGGLSFDGIDNYVTAGSDASVNITGNITVSAWIYMNSLPSAFARDFTIVSKGTALNYYKFRIDSGTDKAEMLLDTGTGVICTDTTTNLEAGQWYHIAGRYNGTTQQLFINGIAGTSCSDTGNIDQNASDILCIGNNECGIRNDKGFDGIIDDVRIYNRALSDNEIQQLYNDTKSPLTCTSFTYSEWSECQPNGTQTRTVLSSSPAGCTGGDPVTTRSCSVPPIDSNLIGYWRLDETGGTTAFDSSGLGNHGTLVNGPTWTTGETGGGLSFDGIDDYVDAGNDSSVNITGNITVSAWIYMNSLPSASARDFTIVSKGTAQNYYKFRIDSGTDKAEMLLDTGTGVVCTDTTTNLQAGQWYHITGRYNGTEQQLFINGIPGTSCSDTGNIDQNASDILCIGNNECGIRNDKGFDGIIDDVRIYNRALSDSEIQQLYLY